MPGAIWFMNKRFVGRVAASMLLATVIPFIKQANAQASSQVLDASSNETIEVSATNQFLGSPSTESPQTFLRSTNTVRVNAHTHESRQAATVYIKNIPVLTYIDSTDTSDIISGWIQTTGKTVSGAIADATDMAAQLEQMDAQETDFTARWSEGSYVVMADDSPLVILGETIQLPDATENDAENVLQVTNRLRRLLGNGSAEPVTEVVGRPAPSQRVAAVRSSYSGMASWYGPGFHGRMSASGEAFNQYAMTAAHRTLPFGTQVRVTNLNNGRHVVVRINDRGPYSHGRIIDLSAGAASAIGLQAAGVGPVQVEVLR
ncbi:MAG: septal ring lytic transglycosylase RlpA family protein [Leptolyngbya sp. SIO3F4]|nr:septal ring lytic transglycosylase RlpA family protein [Leptolyngbya sp. SIO3F4]